MCIRDSSHDLFPTILDYVKGENDVEIDGKSLMPVMENNSQISRDDIFWHFPHYHGSLWKPGSAIRNNEWKLVHFYEENTKELYNLNDDFGEANNLADAYPEIVNKLSNKMDEIKIELNANKTTLNKNYKK